MSNERFYQETFSQVHGSVDIRWEDYRAMRHRESLKRLAAVAAAVAVAAALSGLAVAANLFGLRDILLPEEYRVDVAGGDGVVVPGEHEYKDLVSLSGWQDTPESQALAEWRAFLEDYDQDGAILSQVGNGPTGFEGRYGQYLVYSQEMADELERIVDKYDLELHSRMEAVLPEMWTTAVGDFCRENVVPCSGYIYEDGTFRFDGGAELGAGELERYGTIEYQFSRSVRGTFNDVTLNIGDLGDFQEWGYRTRSGATVTLGLGRHSRSLILADLGDSFVLVNVLAGEEADGAFSSGAIGREELEELADSFDYAALAPARAPDFDAIVAAGDRYMEELGEEEAALRERPDDPVYIQTGIETDVAREFVVLLAERLEEDRRQEIAELFSYPVVIEADGQTYEADTPEELLEHYDETIGESARTLAADLSWEPTPFADGSGLVSAAGGTVWFGLVEDGVIRVSTLQTDQWSIRPAESGIGQG